MITVRNRKKKKTAVVFYGQLLMLFFVFPVPAISYVRVVTHGLFPFP